MNNINPHSSLSGAIAAIAAFSIWGIFPLYFKVVAHIPAFEILAHRILWTVVFVGLLIVIIGRGQRVRAAFADKKLLATLLLSSLLISTNWLVFIWAVANDRVLEASLGYFITPLVNVALGMVCLREKLRGWQWLAVGLSVLAVGNLVGQLGALPWVALVVGVSFGLYGLVRKVAVVDAYTGLLVETTLIFPPILAYLIFIGIQGSGAFVPFNFSLADFTVGFSTADIPTAGLLMMSGILTATPLVLFVLASKRLRLATLGFFQYIAPTGHLLLAVFLYHEPFTTAHKITFGIIWLALTIYTIDNMTARRKPG